MFWAALIHNNALLLFYLCWFFLIAWLVSRTFSFFEAFVKILNLCFRYSFDKTPLYSSKIFSFLLNCFNLIFLINLWYWNVAYAIASFFIILCNFLSWNCLISYILVGIQKVSCFWWRWMMAHTQIKVMQGCSIIILF